LIMTFSLLNVAIEVWAISLFFNTFGTFMCSIFFFYYCESFICLSFFFLLFF
jgi:hypothetical protein